MLTGSGDEHALGGAERRGDLVALLAVDRLDLGIGLSTISMGVGQRNARLGGALLLLGR